MLLLKQETLFNFFYELLSTLINYFLYIRESSKLETNSIAWLRPQSSLPIVMFTGFSPDELQRYQKDVSSLNGVIAKQCSQTTHLIVDKIERTAKLLKCISTCDFIVNIKWLIDSKQEGHFKGFSKTLFFC